MRATRGTPRSSAERGLRGATAILVALALTALVGCGGSSKATGEGSNGTTSTITKDELIAKADAICRQTDVVQKERLSAYEKIHPVVGYGAEEEKVIKQLAFPPIGVEIRKISALGAPEGDEGEIRGIIRGWERALAGAARTPKLVMGTGEGPFIHPDKLAENYGFHDCAKAL
jgi:hypothetical protein